MSISRSKIEVYIDNSPIECVEEPKIVVSYDAAVTRSIERASEGQDVELTLALDSFGESVFGCEGYMHAAERFNEVEHTVSIKCDGEVLISGAATLLAISRRGAISYYTIAVKWLGGYWAMIAKWDLLSLLPIGYTIYLREADIVEAWEDETLPVQFFPVHRDDYKAESSSVSLGVVLRPRSIDEYHPFLNVGDVLRAIASQSGYGVESSLMESDHFKQLYMSGAYEGQRNNMARAAMDFRIKKLSDVEGTANGAGRIYLSPFYAVCTVGSIVDIESLSDEDECFETNDCLSVESSAVTFTPTTAVSVGFEYRMRYTSDYSILSRDRLKGFDTFYFGANEEVKAKIANNMIDKRDAPFLQYMEYLIYIFDYEPTMSYRLMAMREGSSTPYVCESFDDRYIYYSNSSAATITDAWIECSSDEGASYSLYDGDWARYEGFNDVEGEIEIDVTFRTAPKSYTPSSPKSFGNISVQGASGGDHFTLKAGTTITPYFSGYPGNGVKVTFEDLARVEAKQADVMESVQQMFNLRMFVDEAARTIHIDPLDELYSGEVWDWSDRVVEDGDVEFEDCAKGVSQERRWGYQSGDGVTNRMSGFYYVAGEKYPPVPELSPEQSDEAAESTEYGSWRREIETRAAAYRSESLLNPLFSPSQNMTDGVLIVGDRDDEESVDSLNFTPRIVRWCGASESGEPYVSFHSESARHTLCFEDRDGLRGLNSYYAEQIRQEECGQYVTLAISITANELLALFSVVEGMPSLISRYRLTLYGESVECRVEAIEEYRLGEEQARIKFLILK